MPSSSHMDETADLNDLYVELRRDLDRLLGARDIPDDEPVQLPHPRTLSQFERRQAIRALAAFIEAVSYSMKRMALSSSGRAELTPGELAFLREEDYDLSDQGVVTTRAANIRTLSNLRFSFDVLAKAENADFKLDAGSQG